MEKPPSKYYPVRDLAKEWGWKIEDILHYGGTGELQISLLIPPDKSCSNPGPYPISKEDILKIQDNIDGLYVTELNSLPESIENPGRTRENLVVIHEEKIRFESTCVPIKTEMGTEEKENLLRLIGALIEIHYKGNDYKKRDGLPNANKISEKFHEQLALNDFSDKGMSDKNFRKLIPRTYNLIMENKEEKPNVKLKKILPS